MYQPMQNQQQQQQMLSPMGQQNLMMAQQQQTPQYPQQSHGQQQQQQQPLQQQMPQGELCTSEDSDDSIPNANNIVSRPLKLICYVFKRGLDCFWLIIFLKFCRIPKNDDATDQMSP